MRDRRQWDERPPAWARDALVDLHDGAGTAWIRSPSGEYWPDCCDRHRPAAMRVVVPTLHDPVPSDEPVSIIDRPRMPEPMVYPEPAVIIEHPPLIDPVRGLRAYAKALRAKLQENDR